MLALHCLPRPDYRTVHLRVTVLGFILVPSFSVFVFYRYCHPYLTELNWFKLPNSQLEKVEPVTPVDIAACDAVYVEDEKALAVMVEDLKNEKELAVDLEVGSLN